MRPDLPVAEEALGEAGRTLEGGQVQKQAGVEDVLAGRAREAAVEAGLSRSLMAASLAMLPLLLSSGSSPIVFDRVYETWNCELFPKRLTSWVCRPW